MSTPRADCIAVFARHRTKGQPSVWQAVADLLLDSGYRVLVCDSVLPSSSKDTAPSGPLARYTFAKLEYIRKKAKVAVVLGGDGTFLGVARDLAGCGIPLVGINQGRLGFLTDIRFDAIDPTLIETLQGQGQAEQRQYLQARVLREGSVLSEGIAVNDIVISRGMVGGMVELRVEVDNTLMYDLRADGLIVSTPTGSTAYSLSAHGPILHPSLAGLVIVPVAPHALTNRPIALPNHCKIKITVSGGKQTAVHFDMQSNCRVKVGDEVHIEVAPHPILLLHPPRYDYYAMLRQKLHWSATLTHPSASPRGLRDTSHAK